MSSSASGKPEERRDLVLMLEQEAVLAALGRVVELVAGREHDVACRDDIGLVVVEVGRERLRSRGSRPVSRSPPLASLRSGSRSWAISPKRS